MRELLDSDQRLVILRSLAECGGDANESVLQTCLDAYGHYIGRELVRKHCYWLEERGLLTVRNVSGCLVASLSSRGIDVIEGRNTVPGVKRPRKRGLNET